MILAGQTVDTLLVASIPSTIALIGVVATVWVGRNQFRDTLRHERKLARKSLARAQRLDRERIVRQERIDLYRRLASAASANLSMSSGAAIRSSQQNDRESEQARNEFVGILVETQILGHRDVVVVAEQIDEVVNERRVIRAQEYLAGHLRDANQSRPSTRATLTPDDPSFVERLNEAVKRMNEQHVENKELLVGLLQACRSGVDADATR